MHKFLTPIAAIALMMSIAACSKKTQPTRSPEAIETERTSEPPATVILPPAAAPVDSVAVAKKVEPAPARKKATPKVITVNDAAAKKHVDGRLYYDLDGHRYWRNYKDGKYYLYNKSMNSNPDFKKPSS